MFQGGWFTIVLADPEDSSSADNTTESLSEKAEASGAASVTPETTKTLAEYLIHRSLLASISPELGKHTNNEMKEGKEGRMILREVMQLRWKGFSNGHIRATILCMFYLYH